MSKMIGAHTPKYKSSSGLRYNKRNNEEAALIRDIKAGVNHFYAANKFRLRPGSKLSFGKWKTTEVP